MTRCEITSEKVNKDVLVLVSHINYAKDDERIEQIFGGVMFDLLIKKEKTPSALEMLILSCRASVT